MLFNQMHLKSSTCAAWLAPVLMMCLLLSGCAVTPSFDGRIEILSTSRDKALTDAECVVSTDAGSWTVNTPGYADVGTAQGDLRIVCNKAGYRTSEVIHRNRTARLSPGGTRVGVGIGGGRGTYSGVGVSMGFGFPLGGARSDYPSQVTVDMTPLQ